MVTWIRNITRANINMGWAVGSILTQHSFSLLFFFARLATASLLILITKGFALFCFFLKNMIWKTVLAMRWYGAQCKRIPIGGEAVGVKSWRAGVISESWRSRSVQLNNCFIYILHYPRLIHMIYASSAAPMCAFLSRHLSDNPHTTSQACS